MGARPNLYFLTVNFHCAELIRTLLGSLPPGLPLVVVNNSPTDRAVQALEVILLESGANLGFGRACNLGLDWIWARDPGALVWLVNPDTTFRGGDWEQVWTLFAANPQLAVLGTVIYDSRGRVWFGGGKFDRARGAISVGSQVPGELAAADWVCGGSLILHLGRFSACPHFDERYFLYYEDVELCCRYREQGHGVGITGVLGIVHHPSSVTSRYPYSKTKYSTLGYLLTLKQYSPPLVLAWRLARLLGWALVLLPWRPRVALGKLGGVGLFMMDCQTRTRAVNRQQM